MSIYGDIILDHYQAPRNATLLNDPTSTVEADNPLCGDKVTLQVKVRDGVVQEVGYKAQGCAISIASMSMLSEKMKGKTLQEVLHLTKEDVIGLLQIDLSPNRLKCALLSLEAAKKVISHKS